MEGDANPYTGSVSAMNQVVLNDASQMGNGVVYQQVSQSLGLSVQGTTSHLDQMLVLDAAIIAKVAELIFHQQIDTDTGQEIIKMFQGVVQSSIDNLTHVGNAAHDVLSNFQSLQGG
ncbi:MAG: hypothetical protein ETSY1_35055 [Candidatus Entotheonella factor]|uniref:Uncharacterized protein n=1 Tax=Entotheonella factor TaxID=1429438 RepID=W4L8K4_ENTF1|nr:MAG: hypothetical protein ETSY1_35055 [Candidatus Entotheonella factor]